MNTNQQDNPSITVDVALYGDLARLGGGQYVAQVKVELDGQARVADLLARLGVEEKGYMFINAVLCDMPGLNASLGEALHNGDHVGIFSVGYMWPYQYRDGVRMTDSLKAALQARGAMHHTYEHGS